MNQINNNPVVEKGNQTGVNESKYKRIIVASTVGAVLLVVILLFVMIYQLIAIGVNKRINDEYNSAIAEYKRLIEDGENTLQIRRTESWIAMRAKELGYNFEEEVPLN
ncbi:MAG: hypothetical protein IKB98_00825 [Clostridia bacterium]|nr:hypothetical protein [Clostridia bacterium]